MDTPRLSRLAAIAATCVAAAACTACTFSKTYGGGIDFTGRTLTDEARTERKLAADVQGVLVTGLPEQSELLAGDDLHPGTNFQVDPLFDRFSFDYELQWRSPLVDACTGGTSLRDFDNDLRPKDGDRDGVTAPDCGAQEYR